MRFSRLRFNSLSILSSVEVVRLVLLMRSNACAAFLQLSSFTTFSANELGAGGHAFIASLALIFVASIFGTLVAVFMPLRGEAPTTSTGTARDVSLRALSFTTTSGFTIPLVPAPPSSSPWAVTWILLVLSEGTSRTFLTASTATTSGVQLLISPTTSTAGSSCLFLLRTEIMLKSC